jgi:hypothetical protein
MPGAPTFQNAWAGPGFVSALDLGVGTNGALYAIAAAWTPKPGHFQLTGGAGIQACTGTARGSFGGRVAIALGKPASVFGFAALAGVGGAATATSGADTTNAIVQYPFGVSAGWRHSDRSGKSVSVFTTHTAVVISSEGEIVGAYRAALGGDVALSRSFGATIGFEVGTHPERTSGGPGLFMVGLGASYAFGGR